MLPSPSEWVLPSPSESFRVVLLLLFATLPPTHPWFPRGSRSPTRKDSEGQDSEGLGGTRKDSEGLGGTRTDSEGLGGTRKDSEGPGGTRKDSEGIGRTGRDSEGLGRSRTLHKLAPVEGFYHEDSIFC